MIESKNGLKATIVEGKKCLKVAIVEDTNG